jgi:pilus assembly protein CpaF
VHANNPAEVPARLEALAALGGLDRLALHSQLAAAVQVLLHVGRDRDGRRRLAEVAVLRRGQDGLVAALTAWHAERGFAHGMEHLSDLLAQRGRG